MSDRIRQMRDAGYFLGADELKEILDYIDGPSMADILLKNAKAETLRDQYIKAKEEGTSMGPMIASIQQLDR